jgi:hypothetical protein
VDGSANGFDFVGLASPAAGVVGVGIEIFETVRAAVVGDVAIGGYSARMIVGVPGAGD